MTGSAYDGRLILWDVATTRPRHVLDLPAPVVSGVAWSPDGALLACGNGGYYKDNREATIRLVDPDKGQLVRQFTAHLNSAGGLVFSPDGKQLASVGGDARVRIWNPATGERLHQIRTGDNGVSLAYSRDGKTLLCPGSFGEADTYRTDNWQQLHHFELPEATRQRCGFTAIQADGKTLVTREGPADFRVRAAQLNFRDLENGRLIRSVSLAESDPNANYSLARGLSPDGQIYVEAIYHVYGNGFHAWDTANGKLMATRKWPAGMVTNLTFSPDGKRLAAGGADTTVVLWDVDDLRLT